jgi:hypothetical protein
VVPLSPGIQPTTLQRNFSKQKTPTILEGCKWGGAPAKPERYWVKANEAKGKKFGGVKSFVTYDVETESSGVTVQRRYKHFDWLHEQSVPISSPISLPSHLLPHYSGPCYPRLVTPVCGAVVLPPGLISL